MKKLRRSLLGLLLAVAFADPLRAQTVVDDLAMQVTGYTYFAVSTGHDFQMSSESTSVQICTQRVVIVSDCPTQSNGVMKVKSVSGVHVAADGREVAWFCQTADRRTFSKIQVNGTDYRYEAGNTFLIVTKGGPVRVMQIQLADNRLARLRDLQRDRQEVRDFFSRRAERGQ